MSTRFGKNVVWMLTTKQATKYLEKMRNGWRPHKRTEKRSQQVIKQLENMLGK